MQEEEAVVVAVVVEPVWVVQVAVVVEEAVAVAPVFRKASVSEPLKISPLVS